MDQKALREKLTKLLADASKITAVGRQEFLVAPVSRTAAVAAREGMAAKIFNLREVAKKMADAASSGEMTVQIDQQQAVDLSGTSHARKLVRRLTMAGYAVRWAPAQKEPEAFGRKPILYCEMEISWDVYQRPDEDGAQTSRETPSEACWSDGTPTTG